MNARSARSAIFWTWSSYQMLVLDTAPTGHLIRFLELPQVALSLDQNVHQAVVEVQRRDARESGCGRARGDVEGIKKVIAC
jgi:anion-transporting  ArsA/GET3 family ATPase